MEIKLNTLLGTNIPHGRYVSRLSARFFHLIPPHMPRVGHNVQRWTEARKIEEPFGKNPTGNC